MKKLFATLLALTLCCSMATTAFAAEINQGSETKTGNTTITTVKDPTYIVVIPENAEIQFGVESNPIGNIVYKGGNLEPGAEVTVELKNASALAHKEDAKYTIAYEICHGGAEFEKVVYGENTVTGTKTALTANITKEAWEAAKAGNYEATLTFEISYENK